MIGSGYSSTAPEAAAAASLLPEEVWHEEDRQAHDQNFWERAAAKLPKGGLLLFDLVFGEDVAFIYG